MSAVVWGAVALALFMGVLGIAACLRGHEAQRDNAEDVRLGLRTGSGRWVG